MIKKLFLLAVLTPIFMPYASHANLSDMIDDSDTKDKCKEALKQGKKL